MSGDGTVTGDGHVGGVDIPFQQTTLSREQAPALIAKAYSTDAATRQLLERAFGFGIDTPEETIAGQIRASLERHTSPFVTLEEILEPPAPSPIEPVEQTTSGAVRDSGLTANAPHVVDMAKSSAKEPLGVRFRSAQTATDEDGPILEIPRALITDSDDPVAVGQRYRTKAVPDDVSNEQLGTWYLNLDALDPSPPGAGAWPDSTRHNTNGSSCWPSWVIHQNASDVDAPFVARLLVFGKPTPIMVTGDDLDAVRNAIPADLTRYEAFKMDAVGTTSKVWDRDESGFVERPNTLVESWQAF